MESHGDRKTSRRSSALHQSGIDKLMGQLRRHPEQLAAVVAELRSDPRDTITRLFRLTSSQRAVLAELSEEALQRTVAPLLVSAAQGRLAEQRVLLERHGRLLHLRVERAVPGVLR